MRIVAALAVAVIAGCTTLGPFAGLDEASLRACLAGRNIANWKLLGSRPYPEWTKEFAAMLAADPRRAPFASRVRAYLVAMRPTDGRAASDTELFICLVDAERNDRYLASTLMRLGPTTTAKSDVDRAARQAYAAMAGTARPARYVPWNS